MAYEFGWTLSDFSDGGAGCRFVGRSAVGMPAEIQRREALELAVDSLPLFSSGSPAISERPRSGDHRVHRNPVTLVTPSLKRAALRDDAPALALPL